MNNNLKHKINLNSTDSNIYQLFEWFPINKTLINIY